MITATLKLMEYLSERPESFDYLSVMSGQDLLLQPISKLLRFLQEESGREFVQYFPIPYSRWDMHGGIDRLRYYWPTLLFCQSAADKYKPIHRLLQLSRNLYKNRLQPILVRDIGRLPPLFGGSTWFTITRRMMMYCLDYARLNPRYVRSFSWTRCADEIFFQTIMLNSPFRENILDDNLVHIDWSTGPEYPRILRVTDIQKLEASNAFFARKFDENIDSAVIDHVLRTVEK